MSRLYRLGLEYVLIEGGRGGRVKIVTESKRMVLDLTENIDETDEEI